MLGTVRLTSLMFGSMVLCALAACTSDDGDSTTPSATADAGASEGGTGGGGVDGSTADTGSTPAADSSTPPPGGKGIYGTGTYKGASFTLACDFSDFNTGSLMCQSLQWYGRCRPIPNQVADVELFQLWLQLPSSQGTAGAHDFKGVSGFGIKMGNGMGTPMDADDANATENVITVTKAGAVQTDIAGSFSAKWSNGGDEYGEVTGTFDFDCP